MTRDELLFRLRALAQWDDPEEAHVWADEALLEFINDQEIKKAYGEIEKCYA
jgi:hypothetical protein